MKRKDKQKDLDLWDYLMAMISGWREYTGFLLELNCKVLRNQGNQEIP